MARVLTVSDRSSKGLRPDASGPAVEKRLEELGYGILPGELVPDGVEEVAEVLLRWCAEGNTDLVVTTGGSGLSPRDLTPEATTKVAERFVPGLMELARSRCVAEITPLAALGRGIAAVRGRTLIVNLPGHPRSAVETLDAMADVLPHALRMLLDVDGDCEETGRGKREAGEER